MTDWVSLTRAREMQGLRLILLRGTPSPWSQAAKGIFQVKGLDYVPVTRLEEDPEGLLEEWTGQASYPVAILDAERPRSGWDEILLLAEHLAPEPALIPRDPRSRALLFGAGHEICGDMGLGWSMRLRIFESMTRSGASPGEELMQKYGSGPAGLQEAKRRVLDVLDLLSGLLREQRDQGNDYLLGPELTALDIYWATFCYLIEPLPPEKMPLPEGMRGRFGPTDPEIAARAKGGLLELRDRVYERHLTLPVDIG